MSTLETERKGYLLVYVVSTPGTLVTRSETPHVGRHYPV